MELLKNILDIFSDMSYKLIVLEEVILNKNLHCWPSTNAGRLSTFIGKFQYTASFGSIFTLSSLVHILLP